MGLPTDRPVNPPPTTGRPTNPPPTTDRPVSTPRPTNPPFNMISYMPTFGSTPTVSKEITGPPTFVPDRNNPDSKTFVTTECEEVMRQGGCVYVCTDVITVVNGGDVTYQQNESYEEECPESRT